MKIELVTTLKCQATKILADLHETKEPGQPSAYLVDVEDYEFMHRRMQILAGLAKGEQAIKDGKVMIHEEVNESFSK